MHECLSFESIMKCCTGCSKCVGKCVVWVYRLEKGSNLYQGHFLWESDKDDSPMVVQSCLQMQKTYKRFFDEKLKKGKSSGWHAFLLPSSEVASVLHSALDYGINCSRLYKILPGLEAFEI